MSTSNFLVANLGALHRQLICLGTAVDCHKAAYVPVCIAGDQSTMITAEPAVVVPVEFDEDYASVQDETENHDFDPSCRGDASTYKSDQITTRMQQQPGAMNRRASTHQPPNTQMGVMMRRAGAAAIQRVTMDNSYRTDGILTSPTLNSPRKRAVGHGGLQQSPFSSPLASSIRKQSLPAAQIPKSPIL